LRDRPGFDVDFLTRGSSTEEMCNHTGPSVLMPVRGHLRVSWEGGTPPRWLPGIPCQFRQTSCTTRCRR
jgi:hypothetical protein